MINNNKLYKNFLDQIILIKDWSWRIIWWWIYCENCNYLKIKLKHKVSPNEIMWTSAENGFFIKYYKLYW